MTHWRNRGGEILRRLAQRMPWYTPADTFEGSNIRNLYIETAWFGILNGLANTFVSVYALRLGATTAQLGWLAALPSLVNIVWLVPAARIIERQRRRMPIILLTGALQRLGYLAMAAMPFVMEAYRVQALIVLSALVTVPTAVINTAITSLIPDLISVEDRGQVVSVRWLILSAVATAAALLGGMLLDLMPVPLNYQVLFGVGTALSLLGLVYLRRIRVSEAVRERRARQPGQWYSMQRLRQSVHEISSQRNFVSFAIASFIFYWGLYLPAALWSVLRVRELGASDSWVGFLVMCIDASTIVGYFLWGKIQTRWRERKLLVVAAVGTAVYAALTALAPSLAWLIPVSILGGLSWAGCNLALFNRMLDVCPAEHRPTYVALYTSLINVTAFIGPLLGASLANWIGLRSTFILSGGVRLIGALLFLVLA